MADLKTATKVGQRLQARGQHNVTKGQIISSVALGAGIAIGSLGGPLAIAAGVALASGTMIAKGGKLTSVGRNERARGTALDALSRGQTQMGALYGRAPTTGQGALGVMQGAAARTSSDMGSPQTMGGGSRSSSGPSQPMADGQTEGYTRQQNGRSVFVRGYATPRK